MNIEILETRGRKPLEDGKRMVQRMISIDDQTAEILRSYGNGNISQGVRNAAKLIAQGQFSKAQVSQ